MISIACVWELSTWNHSGLMSIAIMQIRYILSIILPHNVTSSITNVLWLDVTGMWPVSLRVV